MNLDRGEWKVLICGKFLFKNLEESSSSIRKKAIKFQFYAWASKAEKAQKQQAYLIRQKLSSREIIGDMVFYDLSTNKLLLFI